jgi:ABC-type Mn2+/Zn2+ transport system permease subunit
MNLSSRRVLMVPVTVAPGQGQKLVALRLGLFWWPAMVATFNPSIATGLTINVERLRLINGC